MIQLPHALREVLRSTRKNIAGCVGEDHPAIKLSRRLLFKFVASSEIKSILADFASREQDVFFVQVGSSDGVLGDPIHFLIREFGWSGLLIEPVDYVFKRLVDNYRGVNNLIFENVAVSDIDGFKDFWFLRSELTKNYTTAHQLGSFMPQVIRKHSSDVESLEESLEKTSVPCVRLDTLFNKHKVRKIDLVHIDVEGYDFEIVKQIDFTRFSPKIIIYETKHLDAQTKQLSFQMLTAQGYRIIEECGDAIAVKT